MINRVQWRWKRRVPGAGSCLHPKRSRRKALIQMPKSSALPEGPRPEILHPAPHSIYRPPATQERQFMMLLIPMDSAQPPCQLQHPSLAPSPVPLRRRLQSERRSSAPWVVQPMRASSAYRASATSGAYLRRRRMSMPIPRLCLINPYPRSYRPGCNPCRLARRTSVHGMTRTLQEG